MSDVFSMHHPTEELCKGLPRFTVLSPVTQLMFCVEEGYFSLNIMYSMDIKWCHFYFCNNVCTRTPAFAILLWWKLEINLLPYLKFVNVTT